MAYSSIAHAGYILMGVYATTSRGREAALLYLLVYAFMAIGAFAVVMIAAPSADDAKALIEEGIEVHPLPRLPEDTN